ncbi:MAG: 2'-5' RNA ligase family protein [Candidatus Cyclobacteriaceae bacterium M3_2C_046]
MKDQPKNLYFIALIPPEPLREKVSAIKQYIAQHFQSKGALKSPPHITLHMPFYWKPDQEQQLIDFLHDFARTQSTFELELENFGSFPRRVIYIQIHPSENLQQLYVCLTSNIRKKLNIIKDSYKNRGFTPHMTVAFKDLKPAAFSAAWPEFEKKTFSDRFLVDEITLLKHNGRSWDIFATFKLNQHPD